MTLNYQMVRLQSWSIEKVEYPFININLRSTLNGEIAPDRVLWMDQIEQFDI